MIRNLVAAILILFPVVGASQVVSPDPIIRVDYENTSAVPGQSLVLRVTVLVPTWMPKPPVMPTYDAPNLMVRSDGRAATPASERIDGETWSGISRKYLIFPLVAGRISIPAQSMIIHFADPVTRQPIRVEAHLPPSVITGEVPEGAADLDPLIVADALTLDQSIDRDIASLEPGDAVVRKVEVSIDGSTPMVIPSLLDATSQPGLSVYESEPEIIETQSGGVLSGSRTESITYVAEAGGRFAQPPIALRWFNQAKGSIEEARLDGFEITVRGPPPTVEAKTDWRDLLRVGFSTTLGLGMILLITLRLWPRVTAWRAARLEAYHRSELFAYRQARRQLNQRSLGGGLYTVRHWWALVRPGSREIPQELSSSFSNIGKELYGRHPHPSGTVEPWKQASSTLQKSRREVLNLRSHEAEDALPQLNPGGPH